jgi:hypothetical protein
MDNLHYQGNIAWQDKPKSSCHLMYDAKQWYLVQVAMDGTTIRAKIDSYPAKLLLESGTAVEG